jgi:hypothetical protein
MCIDSQRRSEHGLSVLDSAEQYRQKMQMHVPVGEFSVGEMSVCGGDV